MKLIDKVRLTASRLKTMARRPPRRQPPQKLQARVRAAVASRSDPYEDDEPQTKLTSAFVVVLILHVVAVGGIYAFNQIKASRRSLEAGLSTSSDASSATASKPETMEQESTAKPVATAATNVSPSTSTVLSGPSRQRVHNVKAGETLTSIARLHDTTISELKSVNSLANDAIRPGQTLNLPAPGIKTVADPSPPKPQIIQANLTARSYKVKTGDRLIFIAKKFNVTTDELKAFNKLSDPDKLRVGQTLKIPAKK
jgi:LysM repeat protein